MVKDYYLPKITRFSRKELRSVFQAIEPPACLVGGWAVHFLVNPGFERETGREYIGSRDIDLGFHVDPEWGKERLRNSSIGKSLNRIKNLGFVESRFGFVKHIKRKTGEEIGEEEAGKLPMHDVFEVSIDILPDTTELDLFEETFGFRLPAEPLLQEVFEGNLKKPLSDFVSWELPQDIYLPTPELLASMKVRSIPGRDKNYKRLKDVADLHALLWYVKDYREIREGVRELIPKKDLQRAEEKIDRETLGKVSELLEIDPQLIHNSIRRLTK
ncbi:hypothetical protein AKJ51_02255 [candidate division MSBL1 archaeon SCGC-AAA382A20]|uniref:Nucleotidyl transferase AbiEii/AbiGii toxin family protein n=1 Tax=candidate division MSBL1 archaeon SCGC-AAA382A20 TaxID=1698280 RepID=A0A133VKN7_9EURY|nr:hypothetical protein AKJ51_02255 [candidate division MSBL1 archaeon SCGC-AAA382A20]